MKSIFFSVIIKIDKSIGVGYFFNKRNMFTKVGNVRNLNLKKSGDLITISGNEVVKKVVNATTELNSTNLNLVTNIVKDQQYIIEHKSNSVAVAIKGIGTGISFPIEVNRHLASYCKINNYYPVELKNAKFTTYISFLQYKANCLSAADKALEEKKISGDQFFVYTKRLNALDMSYVHSTVCDVIQDNIMKENSVYVKVIYHVITTKPTKVDLGGPNRFKPILLYYDVNTGITYYTIGLTYERTLLKNDFINYFFLKNDQVFKNDTKEVQNNLA